MMLRLQLGFLVVLWVTCTVWCTGVVEVRLVSYWSRENKDTTGHCCQDNTATAHCATCDIYMQIFLTNNTKRTNITDVITTKTYTSVSNQTFGSNIGNASNPFKLTFQKFENSFILVVRVMNGAGSHGVLEELEYLVGHGEPSAFTRNTPFTNKDINATTALLSFEYRIQCERYYYGKCAMFCEPVPRQYTCDRRGKKLCETGWTGVQCNVSLFTSTLSQSSTVSQAAKLTSLQSTSLTSPPISNKGAVAMTTTRLTTTGVSSDAVTTATIPMTTIIVGSAIAGVVLLAALAVLIRCIMVKKKANQVRNIHDNTRKHHVIPTRR